MDNQRISKRRGKLSKEKIVKLKGLQNWNWGKEK